ncbi:MAG TPA: DNA polymerase III subunit delta [Actinomycetota bacterium]|nr:DNA polymerase III subunit delta [Actinomycetota bacterium]
MSKPVYLLRGDDFLIEEALDRLREELNADPLSEVSFDAEADIADVLNALQTPSLLAAGRVVILREAQSLTKEQAGRLAEYLDAPNSTSTFVLTANGRTKLDEWVKKVGAVLALEAPRGRALLGWIKRRAADRDLKLDDRAGWTLIESVGGELRDLDVALEQLYTGLGPGARVSQREVVNAFPRFADQRMYALTDALGDRKLPIAMTSLRRLLDQGDHPLVLLGALTSQVRRMLVARSVAGQGASAVADALRLPAWRAERLARQARAYREEELVTAMSVLAQVDLELKGEWPAEAAEAALERAVVRIVS